MTRAAKRAAIQVSTSSATNRTEQLVAGCCAELDRPRKFPGASEAHQMLGVEADKFGNLAL